MPISGSGSGSRCRRQQRWTETAPRRRARADGEVRWWRRGKRGLVVRKQRDGEGEEGEAREVNAQDPALVDRRTTAITGEDRERYGEDRRRGRWRSATTKRKKEQRRERAGEVAMFPKFGGSVREAMEGGAGGGGRRLRTEKRSAAAALLVEKRKEEKAREAEKIEDGIKKTGERHGGDVGDRLLGFVHCGVEIERDGGEEAVRKQGRKAPVVVEEGMAAAVVGSRGRRIKQRWAAARRKRRTLAAATEAKPTEEAVDCGDNDGGFPRFRNREIKRRRREEMGSAGWFL